MKTIAVSSVFFLIITGIIILFFIVYLLLYKRNVNKALNENNGKHIALPDVRSIVSVILTIILFICIFSLKSQVDNLQNTMDSSYLNISNDIMRLQNEVDELHTKLDEIKKSNSLLSQYEYNIDGYNSDDMTAKINFKLTPKSFNNDTEISVSLNDKVVKLNKNPNGTYTGDLTIGIFDKIDENINALISDGDTVTTEPLTDIYLENVWMDILPYINAKFPCNFYYSNGKLNLNTDMVIYMSNAEKYHFTDAYVEILVENKPFKTIDIDLSKNQTDYMLSIDETIDTDTPQTEISIYVVATDNAGFTHRYLSCSWYDDGYTIYDICEDIYDSEGNNLTNNLE